MHRIDCPTATPDNRFTEGDPTIPVAATTVTADWLNAVQEELAAVIASAELSLDKTNNAQLLQALHKILDIRAPLATLLRAGLMQPDGATLTVDEAGLLSALGGNLLLNSELWITESGTFTAPVKGWYAILTMDGGNGGAYGTGNACVLGGSSGAYRFGFVWLEEGQVIDVVVGAGGLGGVATFTTAEVGGATHFGDFELEVVLGRMYGQRSNSYGGASLPANTGYVYATGGGPGCGGHGEFEVGDTQATANARSNATFWGGGGGATLAGNKSHYSVGAGKQGVICVRWHDPAKAAGPQPVPALFSVRRAAAPRTAAQPVTINLYDPETGQGSVWREDDAEAKLAEGLITEEAWLEIRAAKAAEAHAAWLADPETVAERFELLRLACEARLTATDKLTTPDYPISEEDRAAVGAYRRAIRELNHQPGAPWDGGGELTPWPEMPTVTKVQEA